MFPVCAWGFENAGHPGPLWPGEGPATGGREGRGCVISLASLYDLVCVQKTSLKNLKVVLSPGCVYCITVNINPAGGH